jgi:Domain of unknown function (DUF4383)
MAKQLSYLFGIIFVLVGILGFVANPIVGSTGLFETDTLHNIVHLLIGIVLIVVAAWCAASASLWLKIMGVLYIVLAVVGFLMVPDGGMLLGLVLTNMADHVLHIVLGVVLVVAGYATADKPAMM